MLQPNVGDTWHQNFPEQALVIVFPVNVIKRTFTMQSLVTQNCSTSSGLKFIRTCRKAFHKGFSDLVISLRFLLFK